MVSAARDSTMSRRSCWTLMWVPSWSKLTRIIRREALSSSGADWGAFREASTFLWALITVRCSAQSCSTLPDCLPRQAHAHFLAPPDHSTRGVEASDVPGLQRGPSQARLT